MINNTIWIISNGGPDEKEILSRVTPGTWEVKNLLFKDTKIREEITGPPAAIIFCGEVNFPPIPELDSLLDGLSKPVPAIVTAIEDAASFQNISSYCRVIAWYPHLPEAAELEASLGAATGRKKKPSAPFRKFFDHLPVGTIILDKNFLCLEVNQIFSEIAGSETDSFPGKNLKDFMPMVAEKLKPLMDNLTEGKEKLFMFQASIHRREDSMPFRHLLAGFFPIEEEGKSTDTIGGYIINLSDYKKILSGLKTYKEEYGHLFEKAPIGILVMDTGGTIGELNLEMARIIGAGAPADLEGSKKKLNQLLNLDPESWSSLISELTKKGHVENHEIEGTNQRSEHLWLSISALIDLDKSGRTPLINAFINNISDRKLAEKTALISRTQVELVNELNDDLTSRKGLAEIIKKTCDRLRDIHSLRFADLYLKHTDSKGSEYITFQYSNMDNRLLNGVEKLTGLSLKEINIPLFEESLFTKMYRTGTPLEATTNDEVSAIIKDYVDLSKKFLRNLAARVSRIAGNKYVYIVPLIVAGHTIGHIGFNREHPFSDDEKKSVQAVVNKLSMVFERDQNDRLMNYALREKEILLMEIHHRVKNNMQIISSLLALQSFSTKDAKTRNHLIESQKRIRSMAMIHEQLYKSGDLSKINFNKFLVLLTEEIINSYGGKSEKITISYEVENISLDINEAIPCSLIFNELVSNALKHAFPHEKEGTIILSFAQDEKGEYRLAVSDTGNTFPRDYNPDTAESLGLQLVEELTRQLKGILHIDTSEKTEISITFGGNHSNFNPGEEMKTAKEDNRISILIVEDDLITASYIKKSLEKEGYRVPAIISTGEEAVAFCDIDAPDVIIMDILLAGEIDGIEAAKRIRKHHDIPLLYASGNSEEYSLVKAQKTTPVGFIIKPIDVKEVIKLIKGLSLAHKDTRD